MFIGYKFDSKWIVVIGVDFFRPVIILMALFWTISNFDKMDGEAELYIYIPYRNLDLI